MKNVILKVSIQDQETGKVYRQVKFIPKPTLMLNAALPEVVLINEMLALSTGVITSLVSEEP